MDYEKKYKEALERAKGMWEQGMMPERIEYIFPELKESEDERIMKELISFLEGFCANKNKDRWIAWLEKQGQEPKKVSIWKHWKDGIAGNGEGEQIYLIKYGNTYHLSSCLSFECDYIELSELDNLMSEKQDEQPYWKPSEEQLQTLHAQLNEGAVTYPEDKRILFTLYEDLMKIMTQEEKQGEQKPAWNGEDEGGFGNALWAIEQARSIVKDENDMGNLWYAERWLKSLKDRMKGE